MDFVLGFLLTVFCLYVLSRIYKNKVASEPKFKIRYGQSYKFDLTKWSYFPPYESKKKRNSQSQNHLEKSTTRVLVLENQAYWIAEGGLHTANIVDGSLDTNSTKRVDTMGMDEVELKRIIYVIDQLNEGTQNDSGNPGD